MMSHAGSPLSTTSGGYLLEGLLGGTPPLELADRAPDLADRAPDLAVAAEAALRGGRAALRHYGDRELRVRHKRGDGPVTAADHASNLAILRVLGERRSADPVLSEESGARDGGEVGAGEGAADAGGGGHPRLWVVDPLDGTKEFLARNGEFSAMVGLAEEGACVLGAVYQPASDLLHLGLASGGAWAVEGAWAVARARQRPQVRPLRLGRARDERLRFVRSRSHADSRLDRLQEALGEMEVVLSGSVGIKCALIADGRADLYVHPVPYLKEWDTCAPEAVLRGAGGRVTDCAGGRLAYGKDEPRQPGGIFAARSDVWDRVAALVHELAGPPFFE